MARELSAKFWGGVFFIALAATLTAGFWYVHHKTQPQEIIDTASQESTLAADSIPETLGQTDQRRANATTVPSETVDEYIKWQIEAGYRRPPAYEKMTREQLQARSRAGDKFASQKLGELAWEETGDRETAITWMQKAAEQGSIAALTQASQMFDPDSDVLLVHRARFGDHLDGDRVDAYIWARLAAMRGDPDALFGVAKHAKHLGDKQVTQLEFLAAEQYRQLQEKHIQRYGRGFVNNYPKGEGLPHEQIINSGRY